MLYLLPAAGSIKELLRGGEDDAIQRGALDYDLRITRLVPGYELLHQLSASH